MAKHASNTFDPVGPHVAIVLWVATVLMILGVGLGIALAL